MPPELEKLLATQQRGTMSIRLVEKRSLGTFLVACAVTVLAARCVAQDAFIQGANLIDPGSNAVVHHESILVHAGKIAAVGENLQAPVGAQVIDLSGAWVLPGLGDAHQHITLDFPPAPAKGSVWEGLRLNQSTAERTLRGIRNARVLLAAGFTMIRDVGNAAEYADTEVRRAIERGWFPGPTILNAGKIITPFGGQNPGAAPERGAWWHDEYIDADSTEQVRAAVRRNIYYGALVIKLAADSNAYHFSEEQVRAAVDEAHRAGLTVAIHVYGGEAARNAILGGVDSVEHGYELSDELLDLMKQKGTYLVATEMPAQNAMMLFGDPGMDAEAFHERSLQRLQRAYRHGVKMAFGSDATLELAGSTRPNQILQQAEIWQEAGLSPQFILKCMTVNVADLMGLGKSRGAIRGGLAADIIATTANPLENIAALRKVNFVMKDGTVVRDSRATVPH
jgi:imidazolonepropionase-like amidohydrolase